MVKLNFSTNFTSFLKEENKIYHTIKVVTKTEVIECSGAVLCQHSEVLKELFTKENELFLDNYTYVQDCLLILHGDEVVVTMDNIQDLLKFSVQFGINDMYMQVLTSMERHFSAENVMKIYKICNSVSKFARLCGTQLPQDIFSLVVTYLKMIGPEAVMDLYKSDFGNGADEARIDFLTFLTGPRPLLTTFAPFLSDVICIDNVGSIVSLLSDNLDGISRLSESSFRQIMNKIDSTVLEQSVAKNYMTLKAKLFTLFLKAESPFVIPKFIPVGTYNLADAIVNDKLWTKMNSSQLFKAQKLFEPPSLHFIYSEITIAWITLKKPAQAVVTELLQGIVPYKLGVDYMIMLNDKLKALGYECAILPALLEEWDRPAHYLSDAGYYKQYGSGFVVQFNILCRNKCNKSENLFAWFNKPSSDQCRQLSWGWHNYTPPTTLTDDILRCPEDPAKETAKKKEPIKFFGATKNSVHLQFHTDWSDALSKWREGGYYVQIGCVQPET